MFNYYVDNNEIKDRININLNRHFIQRIPDYDGKYRSNLTIDLI